MNRPKDFTRRSLLALLASPRVIRTPLNIRYDTSRQISQIFEHGAWLDSWDARVLQGTKKEDLETGEDAKGE